jgi:hypothetical protein
MLLPGQWLHQFKFSRLRIFVDETLAVGLNFEAQQGQDLLDAHRARRRGVEETVRFE